MAEEIREKLVREAYEIIQNDSSRATCDICKTFGLIADVFMQARRCVACSIFMLLRLEVHSKNKCNFF